IVVLALTEMTRRRLSLLPLTFIASLIVFWIAARQPLAILPRFVGRSFDLGSGYGEAMALRYPYLSDRIELIGFLVLAVVFLYRTATRSWRKALAMLPVLFVVFKIGFTRQDAHDIDAVALLALAIYINLPGRRERVEWGVLAAAASLLFVMALASRGLADARVVRAVGDQVGQLVHLVTRGTDRLERERAERLALDRALLQRRPEGQSFDVYPGDSGVLMAWGLPAARRPIFHATSAYTEQLLNINAAHLRTPGAPSTILFQVSP